MPCKITKSFTFDAAHWLPMVPKTHKCRQLHGHTYQVILGLEGEIESEMGWLQDYGDISSACDNLLKELDHHCLNEVPGLENPTAELLAVWIFDRLVKELPLLAEVIISETPTTQAIFRPRKE